ncbi:hypothetical protein OF001_U40228 [Pseudomonas sp. OF001]|nr:hypothetical protein OF001_U40228 [Pseudomonas sp. OF001]
MKGIAGLRNHWHGLEIRTALWAHHEMRRSSSNTNENLANASFSIRDHVKPATAKRQRCPA